MKPVPSGSRSVPMITSLPTFQSINWLDDLCLAAQNALELDSGIGEQVSRLKHEKIDTTAKVIIRPPSTNLHLLDKQFCSRQYTTFHSCTPFLPYRKPTNMDAAFSTRRFDSGKVAITEPILRRESLTNCSMPG